MANIDQQVLFFCSATLRLQPNCALDKWGDTGRPSSIILSPCSWNVMMMRATKMLTKKKGKTTKYTT
ncbi:hypothetical protein EYF80_006462 [Liparis tanakae]|uniref:Uncharacterized protein n=1 Tax=Liparis tanakae TaxID=230148 RepID=A0A4Z2J0L0_9TELE|nr:hypothetical protein EYF80_006462 [Liparis tanakae]